MTIGSNSEGQLRSIVERIENLEDSKALIAADIKDVYSEAKSAGFDVPALRALIKLRKEDADKRESREAILETYMKSLGMLAGTPLGDAAIERATA